VSARLIDKRSNREHRLSEEGTTLGRHRDNSVCLPGRSVSRFHAEVALGEDGWFIEDHGSTYGTFVNGQKVEGIAGLRDGDAIRLAVSSSAPQGEFNFVFRAEGSGLGQKIKRAARAVVNRNRTELGRMVYERGEGILLVRLSGLFRRREMDALKEGVLSELRGGEVSIVLDLGEVQYMNSYGLSFLVQLGSAQREKGRHLRIFGASGTVLKLLLLVGNESPIEICESQEEATRP
jgi:anti-anti-sigma factor